MSLNMTMRAKTALLPLAAALAVGGLSRPAAAYVDLASTLSKIITDAASVSVVQVVDFDRDHRTLTLKEVKTLKGNKLPATLKQQIAASPTAEIPRSIGKWAEPGAQAVLFTGRATTALMCIGEGWYQLRNSEGTWKLDIERPELPLAYYGSLSRLIDGMTRMLDGRDAVLTMMPHGVNGAASFDLALNRAALPGLVKVQRLRANMKMPTAVMTVSANPSYMLGMGPVDEEDLPTLAEALKSPDAATRASAAADVRQMTDILGIKKTEFLAGSLESLLVDEAPRTRLTAAGALLRIDPKHADAIKVLAAGLADSQPHIRRDAAIALGTAGPGAEPLITKLAALLKDQDLATRVAALEALATLGPVAVSAKDAVIPFLDNPDFRIDAADCLGRMGPRAQPVPPSLIKLLELPGTDQLQVRWAGVRAISQIGGPEAKPAVDFIIKAMPGSTEIDAYNMLVYLALLGPVAKDAEASMQFVPRLNPVMPAATVWAMHPDQSFPWQGGMGMGFGGMFGGGADPGSMVWEAYVNELGDRLRPAALKLAPQILTGTMLTMPEWGYKILNAAPQESLQTLTPHLADPDPALRERAAIALGFMGQPAAPAQPALESAIQKAPNPREKNLLQWSLRQITAE